MAKRFTDTEKWKDPWFKKLKSKYQLFWYFVLDTCDHAGVWKDQIDDFEYFTGLKITLNEIKKTFPERLVCINAESFLVLKFIPFQYGKLNPEKNNAHRGVVNSLAYIGVTYPYLGAPKGLRSSCTGAQDKDKDKDKDMDMDMDMEKEREKEKEKAILFEVEDPSIEEEPDTSDLGKNAITALNTICGKSFRPTKGNMRHINARVNEGYKFKDFVKVVKFKFEQWGNDPKWRGYLRPETIFGTKFDSYLAEASDERAQELSDDAIIAKFIPGYCS